MKQVGIYMDNSQDPNNKYGSTLKQCTICLKGSAFEAQMHNRRPRLNMILHEACVQLYGWTASDTLWIRRRSSFTENIPVFYARLQLGINLYVPWYQHKRWQPTVHWYVAQPGLGTAWWSRLSRPPRCPVDRWWWYGRSWSWWTEIPRLKLISKTEIKIKYIFNYTHKRSALWIWQQKWFTPITFKSNQVGAWR